MITAVFRPEDIVTAAYGLWQWDYGQALRIQGLHLPATVEIHFSLQEIGGEAVTRVGVTKDGVTEVPVPDSMLEGGSASGASYDIYAFIYLTDATSGQTEYKIRLQVKTRPKPEAFDTPEGTDLFRNAIAAVNDAAGRAEDAESSAEAWTHGREDYPERAEDNAAYYAEKAAASQKAAATSEKAAQTAEESAQKSAQNAQLSADRAAQSAKEASEYMDQSQSAAENALLSEQAAKNAQTAAEDAQAGAETAEDQAEQHAAQTAADRETVEAAKELVLQMGQEVVDNKAAVERTATEFGVTAQQAVNTVNAAGQEQVNQINIAGTNQVQAVNNAGGTQVQAVNSAGATQTQAINTAGVAQVQAVENEGTEQVANVQEAAAEIKADRDQIEMNWELASSAAPGIVRTAEGSSIAVTDSSDRPMKGLKVFGRSEQFTTKGCQLIDDGGTSYSRTWINDGSGSESENDGAIEIPINYEHYKDLVGSDIFISFESDKNCTLTSIVQVYLAGKWNTYSAPINIKAGLNTVIITNMASGNTDPADPAIKLKIRRNGTSTLGTDTFTVSKVLLKTGIEPANYEPYTGGLASPNPDYPQDIVSAGQVLTTGAQLFDARTAFSTQIDSGVVAVDDIGIVTLNGTFGGHNRWFSITLGSGAYSLSGNKGSTVHIITAGDESWGLNIVKVETTTTFNCYIDSGTYENVKLPLMINLGSTALPYEPYTGGAPAVVDTGINIDLSDGGTVTQSMPVMLAGGLPGIPVAAGGNYTDGNGQQWVCDEIDFGRGVYVQRIGKYQYSNEEVFMQTNNGNNRFRIAVSFGNVKENSKIGLCNMFSYNLSPVGSNNLDNAIAVFNGSSVFCRCDKCENVEEFKAMALENRLTVLYGLAAPIEIDLTADQIAAFRSLHTNYTATTFINDAGAHMEVRYTADTETYINQNYVTKETCTALEQRVAALEAQAISS